MERTGGPEGFPSGESYPDEETTPEDERTVLFKTLIAKGVEDGE